MLHLDEKQWAEVALQEQLYADAELPLVQKWDEELGF